MTRLSDRFGEKVLQLVERFLPHKLSPKDMKSLQDAGFATLFLGGFAAIGVVLEGDNFLANLVRENLPSEVTLGFVDPAFAVIVLFCIWGYTAYQIKR
ncbi:hypothetical protein [Leisingera sp. F5]|uniref:hypothetical protein n=1 Tax=Leisingera sp. F5 TaxID=1813816 RepID=UPI0025C5C530|nr:hypothetical protein [Leisingera sp. F5]